MESRDRTGRREGGLRDRANPPRHTHRRLKASAIAATLLGSLTLITSTPAAASSCPEFHTNIFIDTASAGGCLEDRSPSTGSGSQPSPVDRWNAYCAAYGVYQPGAGVSVVQGDRVTGATQVSAGHTPDLITVGEVTTINVPTTGTYHRYSIQCTWPPGGLVVYSTVLPVGASISPIGLRDQVLASIAIDDPVPAGSPPLTERYSIVRIPTWFWLDQPLDPITATDTQGPLTVAVTGTPIGVRWDTGDGEHEDCPVEQIAWRLNMSEDATNCSHTYTRSTAGLPNDALTITTTVTWEFTWTLNGTPQGPFGTYDAITATEHQVGEIQVVNRYASTSP